MPYQIANPDLSNNPAYLEPRISNLEGQLNNYKENDKASQLLQHGANVVNANVSSPLSVEVQGRTLINLLGQSTLDTSKYYLFSPNKNTTKITVNGTTSETVTKIDGSTLAGGSITTNFVGKVSTSFVENANYGRRTWSSSTLTTLMTPSGSGADYGEVEQARYDDWKVLNDGKRAGSSTGAVGSIAQNQFSFDIVKALENTFGTDVWQGKTLLSDKVAIAKNVVSSLSCKWYGYGNSATGFKASLQNWRGTNWSNANNSHTNSTVTLLSFGSSSQSDIPAMIGNDGFAHFIAYAEAADSVTQSVIYTDYVELVITTNYTKPVKYTIKQDFQRKVTGSTVENGHMMKGRTNPTLGNPTVSNDFIETTQVAGYDKVKSLDANSSTTSTSGNGYQAQQIFSFDIIRILTDKYGDKIWQGKTLLADKVAIARPLISLIRANWHGYGSSPLGNKAYFAWWYYTSSAWAIDGGRSSHTNGTVTKLSQSTSLGTLIDSNGYVYFTAYAEASDGVTASTINTDYIELEVTVNTNLPILEDSLYEVTKAHYDLINIDPAWSGQSLVDKYPYVQGVQHLNPIVAVDGENLVPPLTEWTSLNASTTIESPYKIRYNPTVIFQESMVEIPVLPNTVYTAGVKTSHADLRGIITFLDASKQAIGAATASFTTSLTVTTPANTKYIRYRLSNWTVSNGTIEDFYLVLGSVAKPFTPRNQSYLCTNTILAGIQGTNDVLYKDAESWKVLRKWKRELEVDGTNFSWSISPVPNDFPNYKRLSCNLGVTDMPSLNTSGTYVIFKYDGKVLRNELVSSWETADKGYAYNGVLSLTVSDSDTGFGDSYSPALDEIKAYFNGWQVKTADGTGKPTAWKSLVDGTDAPTQTLTYVKANKAPNYTPYKLTYQFSAPKVEIVQVEGDLVVDGNTQATVDSGIIIREKATPTLNSGIYHINAAAVTASILKNKALKIINVYKNGIVDSKAKIIGNTSIAYGLSRVEILQADFDSTAEYTVTYQVLEKEKFTTNAIDLKVLYNQSVRSTIDDIIAKQSDNSSIISIHDSAIAEMYKRLKALGG